jgi:hypothetical protein
VNAEEVEMSTNYPARRLVEIRAYRLRPGTRADFHAAVTQRALPMVRAFGMDVVTHGTVPNDDNGYFLVRSFASLAELTAQEDEFYGSAPWREGPREALGVSHRDVCRHLAVAGPGRDRGPARGQRAAAHGRLRPGAGRCRVRTHRRTKQAPASRLAVHAQGAPRRLQAAGASPSGVPAAAG